MLAFYRSKAVALKNKYELAGKMEEVKPSRQKFLIISEARSPATTNVGRSANYSDQSNSILPRMEENGITTEMIRR